MRRSSHYFEGAMYFYARAFLVFLLAGIMRSLESRLGYGSVVEGGIVLEMLMLIGVTIVYYGAFLLAQFAFSRVCEQALAPQYFLPASLAAGCVVGFVFVSELDPLFWLLYKKDMGTIFLSALVVELLFLLVTYAVVWRVVNTEKSTFREIRIKLILVTVSLVLAILGIPLLLD